MNSDIFVSENFLLYCSIDFVRFFFAKMVQPATTMAFRRDVDDTRNDPFFFSHSNVEKRFFTPDTFLSRAWIFMFRKFRKWRYWYYILLFGTRTDLCFFRNAEMSFVKFFFRRIRIDRVITDLHTEFNLRSIIGFFFINI